MSTRPACSSSPVQTPSIVVRGASLALAALFGAQFLGCASVEPVLDDAAAPPPTYPEPARQVQVLDVHVLRRSGELIATNTSTQGFGASRVWLNGRFSLDVASFSVGETARWRLEDFTDEFGQRFRPGGFFAAEAPDPVVLVQLQPLEAGSEQSDFTPLFGLVMTGRQDE
ncbi:MAG: hypothetical protein SFZ23_14610 [Planctomycetota bacterium]|nr:hypothetical protein [Planctomycetota bacterium]